MPTLLPSIIAARREDKLEKWLVEPFPIAAFATLDDTEERMSPTFLHHWLACRPFIDESTGVDFGGHGGVRLGLFAIYRLFQGLREHRKVMEADSDNRWLPVGMVVNFLKKTCRRLIDQIKLSRGSLQPSCALRHLRDGGKVAFKLLKPELYPDPWPARPSSQASSPARSSKMGSPSRMRSATPPAAVLSPGQSVITKGNLIVC